MSTAATFSKVFMAGSGFMGRAIAYLVASKTSASVELYDISASALDKARQEIDKIGKKSIEKGFIKEAELADVECDQALKRELDASFSPPYSRWQLRQSR